MAGYSSTPLAKKLGLREGCRLYAKNPPFGYCELLEPLPKGITLCERLATTVNLIHFFTKERRELSAQLPGLIDKIESNGMIWVSWPKKASKVPTDVTEDVIRRWPFLSV